jgi:hypothetical protein|tara:strand:+ start:154 stop:699 length:546 start_codon:yes stop_codon:yes gene_type:complete
MSVDSAYNLVASSTITSASAYTDLDGMDSTYRIYVVYCADVKPSEAGYLQIKPKVSGSVVTGFNNQTAGRRTLMTSGNPGLYTSGSIGGTREYIAQTGYHAHSSTGSNSYMEAYILNSQSSSHHTFVNCQWVTNQDATNYGGYGVQGFEFQTDDILTGVRISMSAGTINNGKFLLYGLDKS